MGLGIELSRNQENNHMLKEALAYLISLGDGTYHDIDDGRIYSNRVPVPVQKPLIDPIQVQALSGLRDLYKLHEPSKTPVMIHIRDFGNVEMISKAVDEWSRRSVFVHAGLPSDSPKFRFGTWLDPEEFVVGMMTLFEDADNQFGDHRKVVKLVSNLAAEAVTISSDDGYSQQVTTRQGMVTKSEERVSPRVSMAPFRTFREVAQPNSDFILRLRSRQGQTPSCALFEADAGEWKNTAIKYIREYFERELPGADIVA